MRRLGMICLFLGAVLCGGTAAAQHTLGVTGGYGYGNARFYPDQETRAVWGCYTAGVTWRRDVSLLMRKGVERDFHCGR